jgi:hypothetical protein
MSEEQKLFLIAYDYGMGGVWGVMDARSEEEISLKYPELAVVHERPKWMTDDKYNDLVEREHHNIDETDAWGILKAVLADRERG